MESTSSAERFARACARVADMESTRAGIGTLREKTLHAVIKHYIDPDDTHHEIPVGSYVADVAGTDGITEIQTAGFGKLKPKLTVFLEQCPVTIVYPVIRHKWLHWVNPDTGEVTGGRKSPKTGRPVEVFRELVRIREFLDHPDLRIRILMIDVDEYRTLNGWSRDRKKGSTRLDRIPVELAETIDIRYPADLDDLLPDGLPDPFRSCDVADQIRLSRRDIQTMIHVMQKTGRIRRVGKEGRFYLYSRLNSEIEAVVE